MNKNKLSFEEWKAKFPVLCDESIYTKMKAYHGITKEQVDQWIEETIELEYQNYLNGVYNENRNKDQ